MRQQPKLRYMVKPTIRMHEDQWDGTDYTLYSPRLEPRGPEALPPPKLKDEYALGSVLKKEANIFAEYTGLYGFVAKSAYQGLFPDTRSLHPAAQQKPRAGATSRSLSTIPVRLFLGSLTLIMERIESSLPPAEHKHIFRLRTGSIIWIMALSGFAVLSICFVVSLILHARQRELDPSSGSGLFSVRSLYRIECFSLPPTVTEAVAA
jgi:hypothetical protein